MIGDKIFLCFVFLLIVPFISAELNLGFDSQDDLTVTLNKPDIELNYSLVPTVNSSDFWDALDTPADILGSWINNNLGWITSWLIPDTSTDWLYNDSTTIYFNSTKLSTTYYDATYAYAIVGTIDAGTLANTQHSDGNYDGITFDFSEEAGSPGLDLRINFTDITEFNGGVMRYRTDDLAGNYPIIQLWNFVDNGWEDYPPVGESIPYATINQDVYDYTEHVSNGNVSMRIYKASNGNTNNHYYIDWISIYKGYGTPAPEETDPYSWHRDTTGEYGNFTTSGYVNGTHIGDGSQLTGINLFNLSDNDLLNVTNDGAKTTFLGKTGDYLRIGDGTTTSHSLNSEDDLLVTGELEVNGNIFADSGVIRINSATDSQMVFDKDYTLVGVLKYSFAASQTVLTVNNEVGNQLIISPSGWRSNNYDHATQSNPTLYIQSNTNPDINNTQWMSLTHDTSNGVINTGKGYLYVKANNGSDISLYAETNVSATGYITRTSIFDKAVGDPFNFIKDAEFYQNEKGEINHKQFYGYTSYEVADYDNPIITEHEGIDSNNKTILYDVITYPKKIEEGVLLDKEIDVLRQGLFELNERVKFLEENCIIK